MKDAEGWHLSLMYSLAEAARGDEPLGAPIAAKGAATPEKAVEEFIRAIMQANATRAIELIDPEEGRVVHDYGGLIVDATQDIDPADLPQLSELVLTSSKNAFGTAVALKHATLTITTDGEPQRVTIAVDGTCTTVKVDGIDGGSNRICPDDLQKDSIFGTLDGGADLEGLIGVLSGVALRAQSQLAGAGVITHQVDGQWYVAPGSTLASTIMRFIGAFQRADLEKLLKA